MNETEPRGTPVFMRWAGNVIPRKNLEGAVIEERRESEVEEDPKLEKERVSRGRMRLIVLYTAKKPGKIRSPSSFLTSPQQFSSTCSLSGTLRCFRLLLH